MPLYKNAPNLPWYPFQTNPHASTAHYLPFGFPKHSLERIKNLDTKKKGLSLHQAKRIAHPITPLYTYLYTITDRIQGPITRNRQIHT